MNALALSRSRRFLPVVIVLLACTGAWGTDEAKRSMDIDKGVLDEIHLKVERIAGGVPVVIRKFGTENADLGTAAKGSESQVRAVQEIKEMAPDLLTKQIESSLKEEGIFPDVLGQGDAPVSPKALIIEGRFVLIDPGSRAKRYFAGFGAGKSGIGVEGKVLNAAGEVLAEFKHRKHSGIGIAGGDYFKFLSDDTKDVGKDIAKFMGLWAAGKSLKD